MFRNDLTFENKIKLIDNIIQDSLLPEETGLSVPDICTAWHLPNIPLGVWERGRAQKVGNCSFANGKAALRDGAFVLNVLSKTSSEGTFTNQDVLSALEYSQRIGKAAEMIDRYSAIMEFLSNRDTIFSSAPLVYRDLFLKLTEKLCSTISEQKERRLQQIMPDNHCQGKAKYDSYQNPLYAGCGILEYGRGQREALYQAARESNLLLTQLVDKYETHHDWVKYKLSFCIAGTFILSDPGGAADSCVLSFKLANGLIAHIPLSYNQRNNSFTMTHQGRTTTFSSLGDLYREGSPLKDFLLLPITAPATMPIKYALEDEATTDERRFFEAMWSQPVGSFSFLKRNANFFLCIRKEPGLLQEFLLTPSSPGFETDARQITYLDEIPKFFSAASNYVAANRLNQNNRI
jgi:hypothetical protein